MDTITFYVGMGIRGPIAEGEYIVGEAKIIVSYPRQINFGFPRPIDLPKSLSTLFTVSYQDKDGQITARLRSKSFVRFMPIYDAIDKINEILLAFKLVGIGTSDSIGIRTVGHGDILFYYSCINDQPTGHLYMGIKTYGRDYKWVYPKGSDPDDPHGTTELARPHIASDNHKVARRYIRCYELLEHGFYTEAFIVAFSILDDLVQQMLNRLLEDKGIVSNRERKDFLRGIKEQRLRTFLGPLLKVITGKDIFTMWAGSEKALDWLNETRNRLAHRGEKADYTTAALGIFACVKTLTVLSQNQLMDADFTVEFFRHSKITAAWTENAPDWVPSSQLAQSFDFDS